MVIVRDGKIVDKFYRLIKPTPNYYCGWATDCHGLSSSDTVDAAGFDAVWAEIAPKIEGLQLVAHNKSFDESCLKACHEHYGIEYCYAPFLCTLQGARKAFRELPDYQLHTVSAHCGYELNNHHHALADAEACAVIGIEIL